MEDDLIPQGIDFDYLNPGSLPPIARAAIRKDVAQIKRLLENGYSIDAADNRGMTAVHCCAKSDEFAEVLSFLLEQGGCVVRTSHDGETPLHVACRNGAIRAAQLLISNGANVIASTNTGHTPIHLAARHGHVVVVELLLKSKSPVDPLTWDKLTPLLLATEKKHYDCVKCLLRAGANPNAVASFACSERTPLLAACAAGIEMFTIFEEFVSKEDIINWRAEDGWTLAMETAQCAMVPVMERLIELGIDMGAANDQSLLPLQIAADCSSSDMFKTVFNATPHSAITRYCCYKQMSSHHSIPCILIQNLDLNSLKLFLASDLPQHIKECPVSLGGHLYSPISFMLSELIETEPEKKLDFLRAMLSNGATVGPECLTLRPIVVAVRNLHNLRKLEILEELISAGSSPDSNEVSLLDNPHMIALSRHYPACVSVLFLMSSNVMEPESLLELYCTCLETASSPESPSDLSAPLTLISLCIGFKLIPIFSALQNAVRFLERRVANEILLAANARILEPNSLLEISRSVVRDSVRSHSIESGGTIFPGGKLTQQLNSLPIPSHLKDIISYQCIYESLPRDIPPNPMAMRL